jgi:4-amino-4-deoxy-L-arabinose transferase-like glycosyltransferase
VLLIALLVRLGWVLMLPSDKGTLWSLPDQVEYYKIAQNLLIGKGFHFWDDRFDGDVHAFRMPGYPLFVAACGAKITTVRVAQAFIDTSTVLAMYLLARRWLSERNALIAAILVAVNPFLIYFSGLMLSETVFVAMLAWGMYLIVPGTRGNGLTGSRSSRHVERSETSPSPQSTPGSEIPRVARNDVSLSSTSSVVVLGLLLLALSVYIRPSAMLLPVVLPLILRRSWIYPLVGAALVVAVLLPWGIRNKRLLGSWVWTTTNSGVTLYDGFNPDATGASDQRFLKTMPQLKEMSELERSQYLSARAQNYIATSLPRVVSLTFTKIARTWSPVPLSDQFGSRKLYRIVGGGYAIILFGLVVWSVISSSLPRSYKLYLLTPALYFTLVHALSVGSLRYRIPAEAPMAVLGSAVIGMKRNTADCRL